jgi:serine protease Do
MPHVTSLVIRHWSLRILVLSSLAAATPLSAAAGATSAADLQAQVRATATRVIPAVVNISSTVVVRDQALSEEALPFGMTPLPPRRQYGQGSGVIVSPDGYIITNNHVIAEAVTVDVLLADRRQFKGRVVGTDPKSDVAVVKIEAGGLPVAPWGNSSQLAVGDFVLAIGNPLGLNQTVTFGIVSAVGRADIGIADYEDFIQTDAPINPGSSGGALVNIKGELVGINTAIASPTGGSIGVGFAIPSNMARAAMQSLMKTGRVIRGYLGASTQDVSPPLSRLFKLPDVKGVIITDVLPNGPAESAGLERGDVVVRFDGKGVVDSGRLQNLIGSAPIGSRHRLDIIRDGRAEHVELLIQEAPRDLTRRQPTGARAGPGRHPLGGLAVDELTPAAARQLGIPQARGIVVVEVEEGSLAEAAGLLPGDLILEVNRQRVPNLPAYQRLVEPIKPKQATLLLISRQGTMIFVPIEGE